MPSVLIKESISLNDISSALVQMNDSFVIKPYRKDAFIVDAGKCRGVEIRLLKNKIRIKTSFSTKICRRWWYFFILIFGLILPLIVYFFFYYLPMRKLCSKISNHLKQTF